jgi:perosamine synthetase
MHLFYISIGLKKSDEVIMSSQTHVATAHAVEIMGAKPVFVDIEEDTWCIDPESVRNAITPKTKAIMAVHILGNSTNMNELMKIIKKNKIRLIEDTCEALGSKFKKKYLGNFGSFGTYSFYYSHQITSIQPQHAAVAISIH